MAVLPETLPSNTPACAFLTTVRRPGTIDSQTLDLLIVTGLGASSHILWEAFNETVCSTSSACAYRVRDTSFRCGGPGFSLLRAAADADPQLLQRIQLLGTLRGAHLRPPRLLLPAALLS